MSTGAQFNNMISHPSVMASNFQSGQVGAAATGISVPPTDGQIPASEIRRTDVICGRGRFSRHPGNDAFLRLVLSHKSEYLNTGNRRTKNRVAQAVMDHVHYRSVPPGRFIRLASGEPGDKDAVFEEVDEFVAMDKIKQALRQKHKRRNSQHGAPTEGGNEPDPALNPYQGVVGTNPMLEGTAAAFLAGMSGHQRPLQLNQVLPPVGTADLSSLHAGVEGSGANVNVAAANSVGSLDLSSVSPHQLSQLFVLQQQQQQQQQQRDQFLLQQQIQQFVVAQQSRKHKQQQGQEQEGHDQEEEQRQQLKQGQEQQEKEQHQHQPHQQLDLNNLVGPVGGLFPGLGDAAGAAGPTGQGAGGVGSGISNVDASLQPRQQQQQQHPSPSQLLIPVAMDPSSRLVNAPQRCGSLLDAAALQQAQIQQAQIQQFLVRQQALTNAHPAHSESTCETGQVAFNTTDFPTDNSTSADCTGGASAGNTSEYQASQSPQQEQVPMVLKWNRDFLLLFVKSALSVVSLVRASHDLNVTDANVAGDLHSLGCTLRNMLWKLVNGTPDAQRTEPRHGGDRPTAKKRRADDGTASSSNGSDLREIGVPESLDDLIASLLSANANSSPASDPKYSVESVKDVEEVLQRMIADPDGYLFDS
mmetsp:Transcript_8609/g.18152  ORF Transcript_8609/g.18152 Transcript_8609/m.18152 type:complete len:642 (-) Transcript_8609:1899-3824(-)